MANLNDLLSNQMDKRDDEATVGSRPSQGFNLNKNELNKIISSNLRAKSNFAIICKVKIKIQ